MLISSTHFSTRLSEAACSHASWAKLDFASFFAACTLTAPSSSICQKFISHLFGKYISRILTIPVFCATQSIVQMTKVLWKLTRSYENIVYSPPSPSTKSPLLEALLTFRFLRTSIRHCDLIEPRVSLKATKLASSAQQLFLLKKFNSLTLNDNNFEIITISIRSVCETVLACCGRVVSDPCR